MPGGQDETLCIEVVFALRDRQELVTVRLQSGAKVADALEQSSIQSAFPEWNLDECAVGIWGQPAERDQRLQQGDRVEIYRPLTIDPREARRALAAQGRSMGNPDGTPEAKDARTTEED
jgi:hypothetical protein